MTPGRARRTPSHRSDSAAAIIALYRRHALAFDAERSRRLFERRWLDRFLSLVAPGGPVLDLGCGGGEPIARYLIAHAHPVTGVDTAPCLIGLCRERFPDQHWLVADMRALPLARPFAGILAWDSVFHLPAEDQRRMVRVFGDMAAAAAPLLFTSGPDAGEAIGRYHGEPLYHASLAPGEYRALLARHGFALVAHVANDPACGGHTVWLARRNG
jgi:SAM-dependent methyltransferase